MCTYYQKDSIFKKLSKSKVFRFALVGCTPTPLSAEIQSLRP